METDLIFLSIIFGVLTIWKHLFFKVAGNNFAVIDFVLLSFASRRSGSVLVLLIWQRECGEAGSHVIYWTLSLSCCGGPQDHTIEGKWMTKASKQGHAVFVVVLSLFLKGQSAYRRVFCLDMLLRHRCQHLPKPYRHFSMQWTTRNIFKIGNVKKQSEETNK